MEMYIEEQYKLPLCPCLGHADAFPEKTHRSTDSDNEEFCDSMEHLAMEKVWASPPYVHHIKRLVFILRQISLFTFSP